MIQVTVSEAYRSVDSPAFQKQTLVLLLSVGAVLSDSLLMSRI